jgi:hypothetical protein
VDALCVDQLGHFVINHVLLEEGDLPSYDVRLQRALEPKFFRLVKDRSAQQCGAIVMPTNC